MRRSFLAVLIAVLTTAAIAPAAQAKFNVAVGIGDQAGHAFTVPTFKALGVKKARYFIRWDAAKNAGQLQEADAYVAAAKKAGVRVLMHISTNNLVAKKAHLPSVSEYKKYVGKLVKRYKAKGVKEWGAWNEANHKTQPTYKSPKRAAQFFVAMRSICSGCTIVALDVLDQAGSDRYIKSFYKALGKKSYSRAKIVGIHNYSDTNRFRSSGTSKILKTVKHYNKRTDFWLTETGGLASFGRSFPCSFTRQAKAEKYMFTLVKKFRADISRLYSYNFFATAPGDCEAGKFDAGLVDQNGNPRPAYAVFYTEAKNYKR